MKRSPAARWHAAIGPIVKYCLANIGSKRAIVREMNRMAPPDNGNPWCDQQIAFYLNPNPAKRNEPRLGVGLALLEAAANVKKAAKRKPRNKTQVKGGL